MRGTYHCGAAVLDVTLTDGFATARRCDCSFCRRRGAIAVTAPLSGIMLLQGAENLTLYQWGTKTAKHYFCKTYGIYTHHQRRSNPNEYSVNVAILKRIRRARGDTKRREPLQSGRCPVCQWLQPRADQPTL